MLQLGNKELGNLHRKSRVHRSGMEYPPTVTDQPCWRAILEHAYTSVAALLDRLGLKEWPVQAPSSHLCPLIEDELGFKLLVPEPFVERIRPGDPYDPLLWQVLPSAAEHLPCPGFSEDPLKERSQSVMSPIVRKYSGRCLVLATSRCAVHCRFCFRRFRCFRGALEEANLWSSAVQTIRADHCIREVILSGGDPLVIDDVVLREFLEELCRFPHVRRIRIHSRVPIVLPQRIDETFLRFMTGFKVPVYLVVHVNHPREIDGSVEAVLRRVTGAGISILSQSVLLRRVNDQVEVLAELFEKLLDLRVLPYYLHQLDRVKGAAHFEVGIAEGAKLITELRGKLPGYAVPRYVREVPGKPSKEILA